jgi:hypothetical protein
MLFPVTVYNANGKVKEVISKEMLHRRHWKIFHNNEKNQTFQSAGKQKISKELKTKLEIQFPVDLMSRRN